MPAIVEYELRYGLQRLRAELEAAGHRDWPTRHPDSCHSPSPPGHVVTRNVREFARVPGLLWVIWHEVG